MQGASKLSANIRERLLLGGKLAFLERVCRRAQFTIRLITFVLVTVTRFADFLFIPQKILTPCQSSLAARASPATKAREI